MSFKAYLGRLRVTWHVQDESATAIGVKGMVSSPIDPLVIDLPEKMQPSRHYRCDNLLVLQSQDNALTRVCF
jgi:hypothetical protein